MHHFFVEPHDISESAVELRGDEAHHAARVLRVSLGERISVADGTGRVVEAEVTAVGPTVRAEILDERAPAVERPVIALYQAVAKGERMDGVVQKAVEVGVMRIVPMITQRTVVRWDATKRSNARRRWSEIARAAAKQCRSPWLTRIDDVQDGVAAEPETCRVALEASGERRLRHVLPERPPESIALIVGPEGGLSRDELEEVVSDGGVVATLGERVLRTETAGPIAAALVRYAYGSLG
jgi:16S rRNA (uracil1498-N3)-methyltransferase